MNSASRAGVVKLIDRAPAGELPPEGAERAPTVCPGAGLF